MPSSRLAPVFACVLAVGSALGASPAAAAEFDVCEKQVVRDVTERLGLTITSIEFRWTYEDLRGFDEPSEALVYVAECPGFHYYELLGTFDDCVASAHYGTPPDYLYYRGPQGGCRGR